jgi:hypothetical protein
MDATHGLAAILRDTCIGDARAPPLHAPQDEVFETPCFATFRWAPQDEVGDGLSRSRDEGGSLSAPLLGQDESRALPDSKRNIQSLV